MLLLEFQHPGQIIGKIRPRRGRGRTKQGNPIVYKATKQTAAEHLIRVAAFNAHRNRLHHLTGPLRLELHAYFAIPSSYTLAEKAACEAGERRPEVVPDGDNMWKTVTDALNQQLYRDDKQIVEGEFIKWYVPDRRFAAYSIIKVYRVGMLAAK